MRTSLRREGVLGRINEQVRFARRCFGHYEVIDFVAVLLGYAISGERTLEAFYERLHLGSPGNQWLIFDVDGTRQAVRQRAFRRHNWQEQELHPLPRTLDEALHLAQQGQTYTWLAREWDDGGLQQQTFATFHRGRQPKAFDLAPPEKGYSDKELPTAETIGTKLNELG